MSFWPFKKRRSSVMINKDSATTTAPSRPPPPPLSEKSQNAPVRRLSRRDSQRKRRASQTDKAAEAGFADSKRQQPIAATDKENAEVGRTRRGSIEDITALPLSWKLEQSPHLRAIDAEKPHIPYNFRHHATSQTSIQPGSANDSRPGTLKSKRSAYESTPQRRRSSKKQRKDDDRVREEEIRAMSAPIPIPKRAGDGLLRKDSRKRRVLGSMKGSTVSLPPEESIHSSLSGIAEQRGWEVGSLGVFSPRPAIRLSGQRQHASYGSYPGQPSPLLEDPGQARNKTPASRSGPNKRQTIGAQADDLDASDIRVLLERDAKRREKRRHEQQEKLDRKLRAKAGRDRVNSDKRRREAEEMKREQEIRQRVEDVRQARGPMTPPTDVHPALRQQRQIDVPAASGLGIVAADEQEEIQPEQEHALPTTEELGTDNTGTYLNYRDPSNENPFLDPAPAVQERGRAMPGTFTPIETPMEDPIVETAQAVRMSRHFEGRTPPLSPIESRRPTPDPTQLRPSSRSERHTSLPSPPPIPASMAERRTSEPRERRAGAWATFFRRGGTNIRKPEEPSGGTSFQNTSRESMSRGPIPAHLIGRESSPFERRRSGTPTRTQSKFREDLPEMPMSPPDSRVQSPEMPELPARAAAIAAAYRGKRSSRPVDIPGASNRDSDLAGTTRYDTPTSPEARGHRLMSASMASVGSEGSWLASGGSQKRASHNSALSRSVGSLSKRRPDFTASYEELGGDKDAEYFRRGASGSPAFRSPHASTSALPGATADDESELLDLDQAASQPLTVHDSVRRKPTVVHREPAARSREGILTEYSVGESATIEGEAEAETEGEADSPVGEVHRATSVHYGKGPGHGHARQMSAGSAKLLDLPASRRQSLSPAGRDRDSLQGVGKSA